MPDLEEYPSHLLVFAHSDNEVYTAGLMHRALEAGKFVTAVYLTSGDAGTNATDREGELGESMKAIGEHSVRMLRFPEQTLLQRFHHVFIDLEDITRQTRPEFEDPSSAGSSQRGIVICN